MREANPPKRSGATIAAFTIVVWLIFGHLLLQEYMLGRSLMVAGIALMLFVGASLFRFEGSQFLFVLLVFFCSHFTFRDENGGLWNYFAFVIGGIYLVFRRSKTDPPAGWTVSKVLVLAIVFQNIVGWLLYSPMPPIVIAEGAITFLGYLVMYFICRDLQMTPERTRWLLLTVCALGIWILFVCLNQRFDLLRINTPVLGLYGGETTKGEFVQFSQHRCTGTLGHYELLAEYSVLMTMLLIPVISSRFSRKTLGLPLLFLNLIVLAFLIIIIVSETRSSVILVCIGVCAYVALFPVLRIGAINDRRGLVIVLAIVVVGVVSLWGVIGGDYLWKRLSEIDFGSASLAKIESGESINRYAAYSVGIERLGQRDWIFGFGSGIPESNNMAWFGPRGSSFEDFHSLYLSLPTLYGWLGAVGFVLLVAVTAGRCFRASIEYRREVHYLQPLCLGMAFLWVMFLINEYKINILRMPNYQMMIWIWLGLSDAVVSTIDSDLRAQAVGSLTEPDMGEESL